MCYLTGWRTAETAASGAMAGPLFENHVVAEVVKSYRHRGLEPPVWFWRDKERREVDLLLADEGRLFPVEVKVSASPSSRDLRGVRALERLGAPLGQGAVVCLVDEPFPVTDTVDALPADAIW